MGATGAGLPKSAMAKNMSETPREKGVGAPAPTNAGLGQGTSAGSGNPDADAPRGFLYPPRPPLASHRDYDGSCGQGSFATPVPAFGFDTPSPDDRVMAARAKGTGGGAARLHAAPAAQASPPSTAVEMGGVPGGAGPGTGEVEVTAPPRGRPLSEYVPCAEEIAAAAAATRRFHVVVLGHVDAGEST